MKKDYYLTVELSTDSLKNYFLLHKCPNQGWSHHTEGKTLFLYAANLDSIPDTTDGPSALSGEVPNRARSEFQALPWSYWFSMFDLPCMFTAS